MSLENVLCNESNLIFILINLVPTEICSANNVSAIVSKVFIHALFSLFMKVLRFITKLT